MSLGIVDMRLRPPLPTWVSKPQFKQGAVFHPTRIGFARPPSAEQRSMALLLAEMDAADIALGVIMGRQSAEPTGSIPNDEIVACVEAHPDRFVTWTGIDVSLPIDASLAEIRRWNAHPGCKGVSIEPAIAREESMWAYDRRLYPIYEECVRLNVPVNITLSAPLQMNPRRRYDMANPIQIYTVARNFPKLDIHVAHAAWPYVMEMIGVCFVCPNVWLSPDQYLIERAAGAQEYWKAANHYFQDRTLFGTAYPSKPHDELVRCYDAWPWSEGVRKRIHRSNALRLMRMT